MGTQFRSAKLANNYLIPLRGAFEMASRDLKFESPLDGVKNRKHQAPQPDPLTPAEVEKVLAHMEKHGDERVVRYFRFMFSTGLRPEEAIALQWRDVDWQALTIRVERAMSDGVIGPIKTYSSRDVDLNSVALAQLEGMKKWSENAGSEIFQDPATGGPWISERWQRVRHWVPALKAAGVRHRRAYQTRHTFATTALMAGANPAYIARQLGHTNAQMLFKTYSKWIDGADRGREKEKVEAALSGGPLSQNYPK